MIFKNFKQAHYYYNYPSSYRFGTIQDEYGVIRSYSNGKKGDKILDGGKIIYYKIKNDKIKNMYQKTIDMKTKVRFFSKTNQGVLDMGLYTPIKFKNEFVVLNKNI